MTDKLVKLAIVVSILTFQTWGFLPKGSFYIGVSIFIMMLSIHIYRQNTKSFTFFLLLCLSFSNLLDELFFDPTKMQLNELFLLIAIPVIWYFKRKRCQIN